MWPIRIRSFNADIPEKVRAIAGGFSMRPDVLELELDALRRLSPELHDLAAKLKQAPLDGLSLTSAGSTPTLMTAISMSTETLTAVRRGVADRFTAVADRTELACTKFADADADRTAVISGVSAQSQFMPPVKLV